MLGVRPATCGRRLRMTSHNGISNHPVSSVGKSRKMLCRLSRVCDVTFSSNHSVVACLCALMCVCFGCSRTGNGLCYTCESFARRLVNTQRTSDSFLAANAAFYRTTCINNQRCFAVYRHTTMYLYRIY